MTIKSAIGFLSLFIVLQACESKFAELPQGNQATEATFTSVIDDRVMSRAVNASWEANDVIGLFMLDNANKKVLKANAAYVTARGDGNFVGKAGNAVYYPEDGTAVDFIAYYPYDEQVTDHTRYVLDVTDQSVLIPQSFEGKLKITLSVNGKDKEIETDIAGNIEAGVRYTLNLKISNTGGDTTVDPEAPKYAKWFETPVITKAQMENHDLMYVTHNTKQKYKGTARPDMEGQMIRNYSMLYDKKMKMAHWVAYPLHRYYTEKNVTRKDNWVSDPLVRENEFQAVVSKSYEGEIYRRGHQIPSNDRVATMEMNNQTFYFTNQTPQRQNKFNGAIWMNLEHRINSWSTASDTVYVVTGAVPPSDDATWIKEKSIKDNDGKDIPIPSYYFKAVARKIGGKYHTIAFWMQHRDYTDSQSYMKYAVSVSKLEENTGFEFFPGLDESTKSQLDLSNWQ